MRNIRLFIEHNMQGQVTRVMRKHNHNLRQPGECKLLTFLSPNLRTNSGGVMKENKKTWR